jgi:hypothetical protein
MMKDATLTSEQRAQFAQIADILIPAYREMPSASSIGVHEELLDTVLIHRPELLEDICRGLKAIEIDCDKATVQGLYKADTSAFDAISLAASAAYYMSESTWKKLNYPGQENAPFDIESPRAYDEEGLLDKVLARGPMYRPTPK